MTPAGRAAIEASRWLAAPMETEVAPPDDEGDQYIAVQNRSMRSPASPEEDQYIGIRDPTNQSSIEPNPGDGDRHIAEREPRPSVAPQFAGMAPPEHVELKGERRREVRNKVGSVLIAEPQPEGKKVVRFAVQQASDHWRQQALSRPPPEHDAEWWE